MDPAVDGPEALDHLWKQFFDSGDLSAVEKIVAVLDWPDRVRELLEAWIADIAPES